LSATRKPGEVRDAIFAAFEGRQRALTIDEVQGAVEAELGNVAPSSVRSYLNLATQRGNLRRVGRGRYKIVRGR
jgi:site-specific DNA-methyltransferase (adenine-specific)